MFEKIKNFYTTGLYTKKQVAAFVKKGKITPAQYTEITGDAYPA